MTWLDDRDGVWFESCHRSVDVAVGFDESSIGLGDLCRQVPDGRAMVAGNRCVEFAEGVYDKCGLEREVFAGRVRQIDGPVDQERLPDTIEKELAIGRSEEARSTTGTRLPAAM